jgi:nicotinamide-nucleotide amidase
VGTVWIGWSRHGETCARKFHFSGDRDAVRAQTVREAIRGMLDWVKEK